MTGNREGDRNKGKNLVNNLKEITGRGYQNNWERRTIDNVGKQRVKQRGVSQD